MLWVTFSWALESVFLGRQDLDPSVCEQILISLELLLLLFQASCIGYKPALEALLLYGILWYTEFVVTEAHLVFGGRHIVIVLQVSARRLFVWASQPVFLFSLLEGGLIRILFLFGTIWLFFSSAGIVVARLGAAPMTPMFSFLPRGVFSRYLVAIGFFGSVHHVFAI